MNRRMMLALAPLAALTARVAFAAEPARGTQALATARPLERLLFADDELFWFETQRAFGWDEYGGGFFGEVLATSSKVISGDYESWYAAWNATADRVAKEATDQLARGHEISARDGLLRAAGAYQRSEFFLHADPKDPRIERAYRLSVDCYKRSAVLRDPPIEPIEIPYERTTLPGYLHRPDKSGRPRPTLILHTGFDGSAEEMHVFGARAAVERGYNVIAFDGPGQYGPLHREGLAFRPDWEKVITPVVDFALTQPFVDPERIGLMGCSMGGVLAPRAAAFEKRISALIANDGIYDLATPVRSAIPPDQWRQFEGALEADQAPEVDQILASQMKTSPVARRFYTHGMWATGTDSPRRFVRKLLEFNLEGGIAEAITCPTLVCEAEDDLFQKGQAQVLYDHLTCRKSIVRFTSEEGASAHCELGAGRIAFARMYDWLDETLS
jgi:dienelactone hydrolase